MKKQCMLLILVLLLCGCTGEPTPTQPTTTEPLPSSSTSPIETEWPYAPEFQGCSFITPEDGVFILHENESFEDAILEGDVYITANAKVTFHRVWVRGNLYVHGKLTTTGRFNTYNTYAYKVDNTVCNAYDGIHGEIDHLSGDISGEPIVRNDALDYAFETWGKVEPTEQPPTEIRWGDVGVSPRDPAQVRILSGKQSLTGQKINGDVYITSDGDVNFFGVTVFGNLYVAGKLHISKLNEFKTKVNGCIYAYDFGVTCEAFDGIHGQITGEPIFCKGYVVANDALDYAFETWGKQ